jgi:hypothetical protein
VTVFGILGEAARLYVRFFGRGLFLGVVVFLVLTIPAAIVDIQHDTTWTIVLASSLVTIFTAYGDFLLESALIVDARHRDEVGALPSLRTLVRQTRPYLFSLLGATLIYSVCIAVGLLLLVVPGLFVLVRWSVIVPVIVIERRGMRDSFRRSSELVRGHGWTILWTLLIIFFASALVETGFDNLLYPLPEFFASWLGHLFVSALIAPFTAHALAVIYFRIVDLRRPRSS